MDAIVVNGTRVEPPFVLVKPGVSEEEYYRLGEDSNWELLGGKLVMSPSSDLQEDIFRWLLRLLDAFVEERDLGIVRGSRYPMRLDKTWSPEPDLMFVRTENTGRMKPTRLEGPADLVVEIVSESSRDVDCRDKRERYRQARVPEYWMVDPLRKELTVDFLAGNGYETRTLAEGRIESRIVSGFWIETSWLWQRPLPKVGPCLREILA
ncbi:MAG: Uma2 family endonuclease [Planctomycetes bacterium]|nr:Uma2 family endonuclease [Planctomycetota bacterium]